MQEQINYIREKAIEANPSIKDLVFGCRIVDFMKGHAIIVGIEKYENESDCYYQFYDNIPHPIINLSPYHNWTIIGREIRLADVLGICIPKMTEREIIKFVLYDWNLLKDSLSDQSPETVEFIYNLLK